MSADPTAKMAEIMARVAGLPEGTRWLVTVFLTPSGEPDRDVALYGDVPAREKLTQREAESLLAHLANWMARQISAEIDADRAGRLEVASGLLRAASELAFRWSIEEGRKERN